MLNDGPVHCRQSVVCVCAAGVRTFRHVAQVEDSADSRRQRRVPQFPEIAESGGMEPRVTVKSFGQLML